MTVAHTGGFRGRKAEQDILHRTDCSTAWLAASDKHTAKPGSDSELQLTRGQGRAGRQWQRGCRSLQVTNTICSQADSDGHQQQLLSRKHAAVPHIWLQTLLHVQQHAAGE